MTQLRDRACALLPIADPEDRQTPTHTELKRVWDIVNKRWVVCDVKVYPAYRQVTDIEELGKLLAQGDIERAWEEQRQAEYEDTNDE